MPRKIRCRIEQVVGHGDHVYTVYLVPEERAPRFRSGQFLHLALDEYDPSSFWPESRVFSIASSPSRRESLRISYSVKGRYTTRMERELQQNGAVWVKLPYGDFIIEDARDVVLMAGGTGITAFMAFLEEASTEFRHEIYLGYGGRNSRLLLYRDVIDAKARALPCLHTCYFVENASAAKSEGEVEGRLSAGAIWKMVANPARALWYISGPPLMLHTISNDLMRLGLPSDSIRIDAWE